MSDALIDGLMDGPVDGLVEPERDPDPDPAEPAESDVAAITVSGVSRSGDVEVTVVGGDVTGIHFHEAWRANVSDKVIQRDLADAINAGLRAYTSRLTTAVNRDTSVVTDLSLSLRDVQAAVADNPPLARAVEQVAEVVREIEQQGFPVDPHPGTPPADLTTSMAGGRVTVELSEGRVTRVSLEQEWLANATDDELATTVAKAATQAIHQYLAARLEAQVSATGGAEGLASRLYEAQAYVTSALAMKLEGARR